MTATDALADMFTLTPRQADVLAAIMTYRAAHGYSPTVRDMGRIIGCRSPNGVLCNVDALVKKGALTRRSSARTMVPRVRFIPVVK